MAAIESVFWVGVKRAFRISAAHACAGHGEAVGVVDETIQPALAKAGGVGERRGSDHLVLLLDRDLAGDDGRSAPVAFLEDLEEIDALALGEGRQAPVVEDQQVDFAEALDHARERFEHGGTRW